MSIKAKSGKDILKLVVAALVHGRYYTVADIFSLLQANDCFTPVDLEPNESGEPKAYRRLNNALRDGAVIGTIQKNEDSSPFQYRVTP